MQVYNSVSWTKRTIPTASSSLPASIPDPWIMPLFIFFLFFLKFVGVSIPVVWPGRSEGILLLDFDKQGIQIQSIPF
jgi:hypothetical protein